MTLESIITIFGPVFVVISALIALFGLFVIGFVLTITAGAAIDRYQNWRSRTRVMATKLSPDELALRRLQKHLERRLQIPVHK